MSLIRFLSSGSRSLSKGAKPMGRYQLPAGRMLPEFGGPKNPFHRESAPTSEGNPSRGCDTARAVSTQAAPPSPALSGPEAAEAAGSADRVSRLAGWSGVARAGGRRVWDLVARWAGLIVGLGRSGLARLRFRRSLPCVQTGSAKLREPVQPEFSLEQVRVVRNDLTETDYEVVSSETATASPVKRVPQTVNVPVASRPLGRLAERLFR